MKNKPDNAFSSLLFVGMDSVIANKINSLAFKNKQKLETKCIFKLKNSSYSYIVVKCESDKKQLEHIKDNSNLNYI